MKKLFLLGTLSFLMVFSALAQKNNIKILKEQKQKYFGKTQKDFSRAAYLQDSSKVFFHEAGDSTAFLSVKTKYNANGTSKIEDTFIDFFGLFQAYDRSENFYNSAKPLQKVYTKSYISNDGINYQLFSTDSVYYDSKDRTLLERSRSAADNSILEYTTYEYKTNFTTADTITTFSLDDTTNELFKDSETSNVLDSKGNVKSSIYASHDMQSGEFVLREKSDYLYNAQNQEIESLAFEWNEDDLKWEEYSLVKTYYKTNGDINYSINYTDYIGSNEWGSKDSTYLVYGANGKVKETLNYTFDDLVPGAYSLTSREVAVYDNNGNNTYTAIFEQDENDPTILFKSGSILSWWSFFKDAVGIKELFSKDFQIVSANPLTDNQSININAKTDGEYVLTTYNTSGAVVSRQLVKGNQTITPQLPSAGTYIFLLSDKNNNLLTMKKVVKM